MKLSPQIVQSIRNMYDLENLSVQMINLRLKKQDIQISEPTICNILKNKTWIDHSYIGKFDNGRKLNKEMVEWIRSDENDNLKVTVIVEKIKEKFNIEMSYKTIEEILKNHLWKDESYTKIRKKVLIKNDLTEIIAQDDKLIPKIPIIKDVVSLEDSRIRFSGICGIYCFVNSLNNRYYIGSSCDIGLRIRSHLGDLVCGGHINKELQNDFKEYGTEIFNVCILEITEPDKLLGLEREYIIGAENPYNAFSSMARITCVGEDLIRFWSWIKISGDKEKCWEWQGKLKSGYGNFHINGKVISSHRLAYFLVNKGCSPDIVVRHKCNNRKCCSPYHLESGSYKDNTQDRMNTRNGRNKLCWDDIKKIRDYFLSNTSIMTKDLQNWILIEIGVKMQKSPIRTIISNTSWYDVDYTPPAIKSSERYRHKLTKLQVEDLREHYLRNNQTYKYTYDYAISSGLSITQTQIACILNNKYWKDSIYQNRLDHKRGINKSGLSMFVSS